MKCAIENNVAFPFTESPGLCLLLRQQEIWADAIPDHLRHRIKAAAKKSLREVGVLPVDDAEKIARATISLLASKKGRKALEEVKVSQERLGRILYVYLGKQKQKIFEETGIPASRVQLNDGSFSGNTIRSIFENSQFSEKQLEVAALFTCAAALQDRAAIEDCVDILLTRYPLCAKLFQDATTTRIAPQVKSLPPSIELTPPSKTKQETEEKPSGLPKAILSEPFLVDWASEMPVRDWRKAISDWKAKLESECQNWAKLECLQTEVLSELESLAQLPCWTEALDTQAVGSIRVNDTGENEFRRLGNVRNEVSLFRTAHLKVEELYSRLGRTPEKVDNHSNVDLIEATRLIEERAAVLCTELNDLNDTIERVNGFCDQILAADPEEAAHLATVTKCEIYFDLARVLFDPKFAKGQDRYRSCYDSLGLAAIIVAILARHNTKFASETVDLVVECNWGVNEVVSLLCLLPPQHIIAIIKDQPKAVALVFLTVLVAIIELDSSIVLSELEPLLNTKGVDSICNDLLLALIESQRRGQLLSPRLGLVSATTAKDEFDQIRAAQEDQKLKLLDWLDRPPRMKGIFHMLRVYAQLQFLIPLRRGIEDNQVRDVMQQWADNGDITTMVRDCVSQLGAKYRAEARHYMQTQSYLEGFFEDLDRWHKLTSTDARIATPQLSATMARLRAESSSSEFANTLLAIVENRKHFDILKRGFFGRPGQGILSSSKAEERHSIEVRPTMLASWPRHLQGGVAIEALFSDTLRELVSGESSLDAAVDYYLEQGKFEAARQAAGGHAKLSTLVEETLEGRRKAFLSQHIELIAEAESAAKLDAGIHDCLMEIRRVKEGDDLSEISAAIELLREYVETFRQKSDPERVQYEEFLAEAGVHLPIKSTAIELKSLVEEVKSRADGRRVHLRALVEAASHVRSADPVREVWPTAATRLDRPNMWPSSEWSGLCSEAIGVIGKALRGRWLNRVGENDPSASVVRRVAEWVPEQLVKGLVGANAELDKMLEVADRLEEGCGDAAILKIFGKSATSSSRQPKGVRTGEDKPLDSPRSESIVTSDKVWKGEGGQLTARLLTETTETSVDYSALLSATRSKDWAAARRLAAAAAISASHGASQGKSDVLQDMVAIYGVILFESEGDVDTNTNWLIDGCVAAVASRRVVHYLGDLGRDFLAQAIVRVLGTLRSDMSESAQLNDKLGHLLEKVADMAPSSHEYLWIAELFRRADTECSKVASYLWDRFTNLRRREHYRSGLLALLFRCRQHIALKSLVSHVQERAQPLVRTALDAFVAAETQPEARAAALQQAAAFRVQASGISNTQPWLRLFSTLEAAREATETAAITVELDSEYVIEDEDGSLSVELKIVPSLFEPPESLTLSLFGATPVVLTESAVFTELVAYAPLPRDLDFADADGCRVPWSIEGVTIRRRKIAISDTWIVKKSSAAKRVAPELIELYWPGAKQEPVTKDFGFFGRTAELRQVESLLKANQRPRSVMLFGERRIGKTSVLQTLIASMPPSKGRICGAFCDVSGLRAPGLGETLSELFFRRILTAMDNVDDNGAILDVLQNTQGRQCLPSKLGKDIDAKGSLFSALTAFVQRLEEASQGVISRLAICVDEFDRFAAPLLLSQRTDVDSFMWELREVVQRSERIGLVLAGSGIQKLLKENYQDALYGSISEVHLRRFNWPQDADAILDTFMPRDARRYLCRTGDERKLAEYASYLCGGHPMFLALLGSTAAILSEGRYLTPAMMARMADSLVRGDGSRSELRAEPEIFYEPVFNPLEVLSPKEYSLAKVLFVCLAENTVADAKFSSLNVARLFELSGLLKYAEARELLLVVDRLAKAEAIVNNNARVRISVPLTAAAVRGRAQLLRDDASATLERILTKE